MSFVCSSSWLYRFRSTIRMANLSCGLAAAAVLVVLAVFVQSGSALKCWQCNSLKGGNCADDFDPSALSQTERNHFLQECPSTPLNLRKLNSTMQPVCRKLITLAAGKQVFSRSCFYEAENTAPDSCKTETGLLSAILDIQFCESCNTDGCNTGSYLMPLVTLVVLPVLALMIRQ